MIPLSGAPVLLFEGDTFQAAYVGVALARAGASITGPLTTFDEVEEALGAGPTILAGIVGAGPSQERERSLGALLARDVSCLVLGAPVEDAAIAGRVSHLSKPFAAYQVLGWLRERMDVAALG